MQNLLMGSRRMPQIGRRDGMRHVHSFVHLPDRLADRHTHHFTVFDPKTFHRYINHLGTDATGGERGGIWPVDDLSPALGT